LLIPAEEIRKTIYSHAEFVKFKDAVKEKLVGWQKASTTYLKEIGTTDHPKAVIQRIGDSILTTYSDVHLLDKYDIYQCLMAYWEETMQDDIHIITSDGWGAGNEVIRLQKDSKGKKKDIEGLEGLEGRLISISLLIKTHFSTEQSKLDELNAKLEQIVSKMDELKDEHGGEEGLLLEVIDNDKITKGAVSNRIKDVKGDPDCADELALLEQYVALFEQDSDTKKKIKDAEQDLERKVIKKYPELTQKDIKLLVVERKWMDEIETRVMGELDRLSQRLAGRVKELAERYRETLPQIGKEVETLTAKTAEHLKKMGFKL
jgi:type I restriction enzyme M protein